jgi:hypothetical protein
MLNMIKRTFSQQKINLPMKMEEDGKYLKGSRHSSEKTFSFWDLTGNYQNRFCTDFSTNKTIATQLPSLKCQWGRTALGKRTWKYPDIETPKKKEWFQGHCMLEK